MNKFLTVIFAICAMTQVGHAQEASFQVEELNQNEYSSTMDFNGDMDRPGHGGRGDDRGGRGPGRGRGPGHGGGWGPGRPGPGHGPGRPGPGPGRPPQYPPSYRVEYFQCGSYGYQYNECYINSFRVNSIRIYRQDSREACIYGRTYGFSQNRIWTTNACRAVFAIERY